MNKTLVIATLLVGLTTLALVPSVSARPDLPPLVGACVGDGCPSGSIVCVGFSYQVPQCVRDPGLVCTEICQPCMTISCDGLPL